MALEWQTIAIPFGQGLAQDIAPSLIPPGKLVQALDTWINKTGSFEHRPGTRWLSRDIFDGSALNTGYRLVTHNNQLLLSTQIEWYSYAEHTDKWIQQDLSYEATIHKRVQGERGRDAYSIQSDVVYAATSGGGGVLAVAWAEYDADAALDKIGVRFTDYDTGAPYPIQYSPSVMGNPAMYWRLAVTGTVSVPGSKVHLVYVVASSTSIIIRTWDPSDLTAAAVEHTVHTELASSLRMEAVSVATSKYLWIAFDWDDTAGTIGIKVLRVDTEAWTTSVQTWSGAALSTVDVRECLTIAVNETANAGIIAWNAKDGALADHIYHAGFTPTTMAKTYAITYLSVMPSGLPDDFTQRLGAVIEDGGNGWIVYEFDYSTAGASTGDALGVSLINTTTGVDSEGGLTWGVRMISKPIVWAGAPDGGDQCYIAARWTHEAYSLNPSTSGTVVTPTFRNAYLLHLRTLPYVVRPEA